MKNDFKVQPSKEKLKSDLELVGSIIKYQNRGDEILIAEGVVSVKTDDRRIELGTLTDINALTKIKGI